MKKISITIGIPAYNEEKSISKLLTSILSQKKDGFFIDKIIIVSDASTDNTDNIIRSFSESKIKLIRNKVRMGQIYSQNLILRISNSDVLVLLEADTYLKNHLYLRKIIQPFLLNNKLSLVQGYAVPLPPTTLIEKALYFSDRIFCKHALRAKNREDLFISGAGGKLLSKKLYSKFQWPNDVPEDLYLYLWCKQNGMQIYFQENGVTIYRLPQTFRDYLKKRQKILSGPMALKNYYSEKLVKNSYSMPLNLKLRVAFSFFFSHFIFLLIYLTIISIEKFFITNFVFDDFWGYASTTKVLDAKTDI